MQHSCPMCWDSHTEARTPHWGHLRPLRDPAGTGTIPWALLGAWCTLCGSRLRGELCLPMHVGSSPSCGVVASCDTCRAWGAQQDQEQAVP